MYILSLIFCFYCFIKFFFYGIYEFEQKNKLGGIAICFLAVISLIFPSSVILYYYII